MTTPAPGAPAGGREAAGLWVVGVPSLAGAVLDAADVVIPSLADVDPRSCLTAPGGPADGR